MPALSSLTQMGSVLGKLGWLRPVVLKPEFASESPWGLVETHMLGPDTQRSWFGEGGGGTHASALPTSSQVMVMSLVQRLHLSAKTSVISFIMRHLGRKSLGVPSVARRWRTQDSFAFLFSHLHCVRRHDYQMTDSSSIAFSQESRQSGMKSVGANTGRKGFSSHARSSLNPQRPPVIFPLSLLG